MPDVGANATKYVRVEALIAVGQLEQIGGHADHISQRNSLQLEGIPPRLYLELLRRPDFDVPITKLGKLRLVERSPFVAWLRARAARRPELPGQAHADLDDVDRIALAAGGKLVR